MRFNNANQSLTTIIDLSFYDRYGNPLANLIEQFASSSSIEKANIEIQTATISGNFFFCNLYGMTSFTTYAQLNVDNVTSSFTFPDGIGTIFSLSYVGDAGTPGPTGPTVSNLDRLFFL
jgi:hypothetical protein